MLRRSLSWTVLIKRRYCLPYSEVICIRGVSDCKVGAIWYQLFSLVVRRIITGRNGVGQNWPGGLSGSPCIRSMLRSVPATKHTNGTGCEPWAARGIALFAGYHRDPHRR